MFIQLETDEIGIEYFYDTEKHCFCWRVPDIREIISAKPNHIILSADFSQIEIKIMAFLSNDKGLIAAVNSGKDIHCYIATDIAGQKYHFDYDLINKVRKDELHPRHVELALLRSKYKVVTFGIPYGAGPNKVAEMTGMSPDESAEFIEDYLGKYPDLRQWLKDQGDKAIYYGYSQSIGGRKRFYDIPEPEHRDYDQRIAQIRRWGSNQPIQGSCSDMLKRAMMYIKQEIKARKLSGKFKLVVHDEIVMEWLESEQEIGIEVIKNGMNKAYDYYLHGIINVVDVATGHMWKKV